MDFHFEGFTAGLVDMWAFYHRKAAAAGWQGYGAAYLGAGSECCINNLPC